MALTKAITPATTPPPPPTDTITTPGGTVDLSPAANSLPAAPDAGSNLFSNIVDSALASSPLVGTVAPQNQITLGVPADAYAATTQKLGWLETIAAIGVGGILYLLFLRS